MSDTKTINTTGTKSGNAKKVAGQAATIVGSAGLGVAGTMFANAESNDGEKTVVEAEAVSDEVINQMGIRIQILKQMRVRVIRPHPILPHSQDRKLLRNFNPLRRNPLT